MDPQNVKEPQGEDKALSWADIVADTMPRPGASFSELLSWTLGLAESSDQLPERDCTRFREAVGEHLMRLTGDEAEKLMGVLAHLFAIAHRRAPASQKASVHVVRRDGRYRVAKRFLRLVT